jgi:putative aldouronate transport system substrate-binding protein
MKKGIVVFSILLVAMTMVFAQAAVEQTSRSASNEIVDIRVMVYERGKELGNGYTTTDNLDTRWINSILEKEGVHVTYVPVARSGSDNTVNSLLAAGDAPDVIMTYDRERVSTYGKQGGLVALNDYIDRLDPGFLKMIEGVPLSYCTFDGNIYALPRMYGTGTRGHQQYIRKDLCDAMGIAIPTTRGELIDYLYKVKANYPDIIPYAFGGKVTDACFFNFVLSYTSRANERDNYIYEPTFTNVLKPGSKEGFRQLNQFVLDGIIPPDFAIDTDETKFKQAQANGKIGFLLYGKAEDPALTPFGTDPSYMLWPCDCLENADGDYIVPSSGALANYVYVPKTAEKKMDAIMKYLNFMSVKENAIDLAFHVVGVGSQLNEDGIPVLIATATELQKQGYSPDTSDLNMLYTSLNWGQKGAVDQSVVKYPTVPRAFFDEEYRINKNPAGYYDTLKIESALPSDQYVPLLQSLICEFAFKVMNAPKGQFEKVWNESWQKMVENHLNEVLDERAAWYDANKK